MNHSVYVILCDVVIQAVRKSNFRYTAAKMCSCLSEQMNCASGITFQSYLVNRFEAL